MSKYASWTHGKLPLPELAELKRRGQKLAMVTAYDFPSGRIADEDHVCAGRIGEPARRRVVGGDHRDRRVALLHPEQLGDRELAGAGRSVARGTWAGAHEASSNGTLSIRRVPPTWIAAARTGGSNGATST